MNVNLISDDALAYLKFRREKLWQKDAVYVGKDPFMEIMLVIQTGEHVDAGHLTCRR